MDHFGDVIDQNWVKNDGTTVDRYQYSYDRNGNVTAKNNLVNASLSEAYTYDDLDRLTSATRNGTAYQSWDLDSLGNSDITTGGVTEDRDFNSQNQIMGIEYDANGNTLTDEAGNHYVYDAWNHLVQVKDAQGNTLKSYTYDALGRRVTETTGSGETAKTTTLYYNASWQLVEERTVDAATGTTTTTQYVWSATYIDAMVCRDQTVTSESGSTTQRIYAIHDANFNVTAIADASGQILERYAYDAYGKFTILNPDGTTNAVQTTTAGWNYLHQGGRYDATTGLYNFRNRDYNPETQRWLQQDPLGYVDGTNTYQYVKGNPSNNNDPSGLSDQVFGPDFLGNTPDQWRNLANSAPCNQQPTTQPAPASQPRDRTADMIDRLHLDAAQKRLKELESDRFYTENDAQASQLRDILQAGGYDYPSSTPGGGSRTMQGMGISLEKRLKADRIKDELDAQQKLVDELKKRVANQPPGASPQYDGKKGRNGSSDGSSTTQPSTIPSTPASAAG